MIKTIVYVTTISLLGMSSVHAAFQVSTPETAHHPMIFQSVDGLEQVQQKMTYRHSDSPVFSTIKMPGIAKYDTVTLSDGIIPNDSEFWAFYSHIKLNTLPRQNYTVLGPDGTKFVLMNAWPVYVSNSARPHDGATYVTVQELKLAHEQLIVYAPSDE